MPNKLPRLSELPDFLPAGAPGSPERRACAVGTFTNARVNAQFIRFMARLTLPIPTHHASVPATALENGVPHAS